MSIKHTLDSIDFSHILDAVGHRVDLPRESFSDYVNAQLAKMEDYVLGTISDADKESHAAELQDALNAAKYQARTIAMEYWDEIESQANPPALVIAELVDELHNGQELVVNFENARARFVRVGSQFVGSGIAAQVTFDNDNQTSLYKFETVEDAVEFVLEAIEVEKGNTADNLPETDSDSEAESQPAVAPKTLERLIEAHIPDEWHYQIVYKEPCAVTLFCFGEANIVIEYDNAQWHVNEDSVFLDASSGEIAANVATALTLAFTLAAKAWREITQCNAGWNNLDVDIEDCDFHATTSGHGGTIEAHVDLERGGSTTWGWAYTDSYEQAALVKDIFTSNELFPRDVAYLATRNHR